MFYNLEDLQNLAYNYDTNETELVEKFTDEPYTRIPILRNEKLDIILICFKEGQTSSVHDHKGSNCVIKVIKGKLLESLFEQDNDNRIKFISNHELNVGDVSGLDGKQIHQLANLDNNGTVLLNFYSPPFSV